MPRIINGQYFEDGKPGTRIINTEGGNYTEKIEGDFIQGNVIGSTPKPAPQRKDLSKDGEAIDVEATEEKEEKVGLAKLLDFFK
ncbi:hypothetical protein QUA13_24325 [Microcoleus sp. S28C3]|uniref:hypothetical protein n=1 Tax=Microcoleus sp. S28C3 TaxID=3055414 RepID=UPI002FCEAB62